LRKEPRLKSRIKIHHNNLFCNLNQPYNLLKLPPELPLELPLELLLEPEPLLKPEHPSQRNMNDSQGQIKEIEMHLPNCSQI
jgi:hypothetical protein